MTSHTEPPATGAQPHSHLLLNRVVTGMLRSPLHPLLSGNLLLITYRGRRTGRSHTLPVSYLADGEQLLVFSNQRWWRNLRGGAPVQVRLRGRQQPAHAEVVEDRPEVVSAARTYLARKGARAASRINLRLPPGHDPSEAELTTAAAKHVLVRITPTAD